MLESFPEGMYLLFRTDLLIYVSGLLVDSVVFKIGDILEMGNNWKYIRRGLPYLKFCIFLE